MTEAGDELLERARAAASASRAILEKLQSVEEGASRMALRAESSRLRAAAQVLQEEREGYANLIAELQTTVAQLEEAMVTRAVIEQAKGIIMASRRCDADAAFDVLRTISQNRNQKLHEVAADLVARATAGPSEPPSDGAKVGDSRRSGQP